MILYKTIKKIFNESNLLNLVKEDDTWFYCIFDKKNLPSQGWKGHLSVKTIDANSVVYLALQYLIKKNISFKIVKSLSVLKKINGVHYPLGSANKFITLYPKNYEELEAVFRDLNQIIGDYETPMIFTDKQVIKNKSFHYRYGSFIKKYRYSEKENRPIYLIKDLSGEYVEDIRKVGHYKPDFIEEPYKMNLDMPIVKNVASSYFNKKYKIVRSLSQSNKGSVSVIVGKENNKKFILKEARKNIFFDYFPYTSINLLLNEIDMLNTVSKLNITPKVIDVFKYQDSTFFVEEYIEGIPLSKFIENNTLDISRKILLINDLIREVKKIHQLNIVIGDISTNNFIINNNNKIIIIDLETASNKNNRLKKNIGTPIFTNTESNMFNSIESDDYSLLITIFSILLNSAIYLELNKSSDYISWKEKIYIIFEAITNLYDKNLFKEIPFIKEFFYKNKIIEETDNFDIINIYIGKLIETINYTLVHNDNYWNIIGEFAKERNKYCIQHGYLGRLSVLKYLDIDIAKYGKYLDKIERFNFSEPGYLFGSAGIVLGLLEINRNDLITVGLYNSMKINIMYDDFALGYAGIAYTQLCLLLNEKNNLNINNDLKNNYYYLLKKVSVDENDDLGFAHGKLGILFSLYFIAKYFKFEKDIPKIIADVEKIINIYKRRTEISEINIDYSYCKGISGMISALAQINYIEKNNNFSKFILDSVAILEKGLPKSSMNNCHGAGSILEAISDVEYFMEYDMYEKKQSILKFLYIKTYYKGDHLSVNNETRDIISYDFGTGFSGIVYSLIRAQNNSRKLFFLDKERLDKL